VFMCLFLELSILILLIKQINKRPHARNGSALWNVQATGRHLLFMLSASNHVQLIEGLGTAPHMYGMPMIMTLILPVQRQCVFVDDLGLS